jgi:Tol biopolymer transport system component
MDVTAGTRLGPYQIVAPLGAGGMGQVYRARDTRLKRDVALKVISDRIRDRPHLRERFNREATAVAALNHPNICQVFDVGAHAGIDFIVMELVDGETLSARLARGALSIDEGLRVARELTAAVGAAHRAGVVHRDIKPSNIMLTRTGIKLLDFGLARQRDTPTVADASSTQAPRSDPLTLTGMVLGTWQYMSPEQLRGAEADARSDVFSVGVVLYEAFTSKRLCQRPTHEASLIAILEDQPASMTTIRPEVPATVDRVVAVCLAKDPTDRWQTAGDLHHALEAHADASPEMPRLWRSRAAASVAAAVVIVAVMGAALWPRGERTGNGGRTIRSTIDVRPLDMQRGHADLQFLPDGRGFIFSAFEGGRLALFRYDLAAGTAKPIIGTAGAAVPFLSPDGKWIGFNARGGLMKVPIDGGQAIRLAEQLADFGASWGDDGFIVYSSGPASGLRRVADAGGTSTTITELTAEDQGNDHRYPVVLPGGRRILFAVGTGPEESARIVGLDLVTGERKDLVRGAMSFRYLPSGFIAYVSNDALFVVPFDRVRFDVSGAPVRIAEGVENAEGDPEFAFSPDDDLIYLPGASTGSQFCVSLIAVDGSRVETLPDVVGQFASPRFSPDGTKLLLMRGATKNNLWVYDLVRTTLTRVSYGRYQGSIWTRDGRITTPRGGPGDQRIVIRNADGTGDDSAPLTDGGIDERPADWTPDGRTLLYNRGGELWSVTPGRTKPAQILPGPFSKQMPRLSPDGRLITYTANDTGANQVYVSSLSGEGGRVQVSARGGAGSVWSPDGRRVYFRGPIGESHDDIGLLVSEITTQPRLSASTPRLMFRNNGYIGRFDLSPDGKQFVMITFDTRPPSHTLRMVQNWRALLPSTTRD